MTSANDLHLYERRDDYIPRVAAVHDLCGYGKCSLGVAIPVLSAAGCDVCPVPTGLFSSHTAFPGWYMHDTTEILADYLNAWKGIGVEPNMQKALYWTNLSAIHGDWDAQCNLATFYEEGLCGEKNLEKAKYWYSRAALQEEEESVEKCRKFGISVTEKYKPDLSNVPHWHFELQQPAADHLLKLVLEGKKRATSSSLAAYRSEGEAVPKPGDWNALTNWEGKPGCLIVTTQVEILPFREIGFELAEWEGEDECLESWRKNHIAFFTEEGKQLGYSFSEEMPVVFERFEVLETL